MGLRSTSLVRDMEQLSRFGARPCAGFSPRLGATRQRRCCWPRWRGRPSGRAFAASSANEIRIGNTVPYTGPASAYGVIGKVLAAYFDKVNAEGGINGRKINFISYDDAYNPDQDDGG